MISWSRKNKSGVDVMILKNVFAEIMGEKIGDYDSDYFNLGRKKIIIALFF
jgi:hypothetical protein